MPLSSMERMVVPILQKREWIGFMKRLKVNKFCYYNRAPDRLFQSLIPLCY